MKRRIRPNEYLYLPGGLAVVLMAGGVRAILDAADVHLVSPYRWNVRRDRSGACYAVSHSVHGVTLGMHRIIMGAPVGMIVDHVNRDGLDNRRSNLRLATHAQNMRNRKRQSNNTSGYHGVTYWKHCGRYAALIRVDGKRRHIGLFATAEEAALAYDEAARSAHGEFASLNFPTKVLQ
jgi:hypothetical protein